MKKIFLLTILSSVILFSCDRDFGDLNVDKKKPSEVPGTPLFANAQKELADLMASSNVNVNIFRLLSQYWTETTYVDESRYDLNTRNIPQNFWNGMYRDVLKNLSESQTRVIAQDPKFIPQEVIDNQNAAIELLTAYSYSVLVNTFGDVPYSEALDIENVTPKYDDDAAIYADLLNRIDAALASIDESSEGFGSSDLICHGDMGCWSRFGNSLKLRMGITLADVDASAAQAAVEAAAPNVVKTNAENVTFQYLTAPPNTNPVWVDLVQSNRKDFVAANTIVDIMKSLNDPRIPAYFTGDASGEYNGGIYGSPNSFATYSKPSNQVTLPDAEYVFFDAAEMEFILAEAAERGYNVDGTAAGHYEAAIRASLEYWGVSQDDADAYLAMPEVAYESTEGSWQQKIGTQKWIAFYNRGYEGWTEWRRLDFPIFNVPDGLNYTDIPLRFTYPVGEQTLNKESYTAAAAAIGGDVVETRVFWDEN